MDDQTHLNMLINREDMANHDYRLAAVNNPQLKDLFTEISKDELEHKQELEKLKKGVS